VGCSKSLCFLFIATLPIKQGCHTSKYPTGYLSKVEGFSLICSSLWSRVRLLHSVPGERSVCKAMKNIY